MTAIFGVFQRDNQSVPSILAQKAAQTLRYHALDGLELWQAETVSLGQALTRFCNSCPGAGPRAGTRPGL